MPVEFDRMVEAIKRSIRKEFLNSSDKQVEKSAYAIAVSRWKKSHHGQSPFN